MFKEHTDVINSHWSVNQIGFKEMIEKNFSKNFLELLESIFYFSFRQRGWTKYEWKSNKIKVSISDDNSFRGKLNENVIFYFHNSNFIHFILNKLFNPRTTWIKCIEFLPLNLYEIKYSKSITLIDHDYYGTSGILVCYNDICEVFENKKISLKYITSNGFENKPGSYRRNDKIDHVTWIKELKKAFYFIPTKQESGGLTILEHLVQGGVVLIYYKLKNKIPLDNYIENIDYYIFKDFDDYREIISITNKLNIKNRSKDFLSRYFSKQLPIISYLNENINKRRK